MNGHGTIPFQIRRDERVFLTGRTGSGKTTLADRLIRTLGYRTVVLDPKGSWTFPGYRLTHEYIADPGVVRQLFRPRDHEAEGWADTQDFLSAVWYAGIPTVVYVDELTRLSTPYKTAPMLADFVRLGRQAGYGTWTGSQRPSGIPTLYISEADHLFVFDLRTPADREKLAGFAGPQVEERMREKYAFWYVNPDQPDPILVHQQ